MEKSTEDNLIGSLDGIGFVAADILSTTKCPDNHPGSLHVVGG